MRTEGTLDNPATLRAQEFGDRMRDMHAGILASLSQDTVLGASMDPQHTELVTDTAETIDERAQEFGDRMRDMHAGILASLARKDDLPVTEAPAKPLSAEEQRVLDGLEAQFQEPEISRERRLPRLRRAAGLVALGAVVAPVTFFGVTAGQSAWHESRHGGTPAQAAVDIEPAMSAPPRSAPAAEATTTTVEATTTTAVPEVPFTANIGDRSGVLSIPKICEDGIEVYEQDEADVVYDSSTDEWHFTEDAPINRRESDLTPLGYCEGSADLPYQGRLGRSDKTSNRGDASQFQPVAVHEQNQEGLLSVYPGQEGNAVLMSHRTTYGAGFGDIGALEAGDDITFERSDGKTFVYRVVGHEVKAAINRDSIYNWSHPDSGATLTLYACSKENGTPTSSAFRYVVRAVLVEVDGPNSVQ